MQRAGASLRRARRISRPRYLPEIHPGADEAHKRKNRLIQEVAALVPVVGLAALWGVTQPQGWGAKGLRAA